MNDNDNIDKTKFGMGFADSSKDVMVIFIPVKHYADSEDGTALVRGKIEEVKGIVLLHIQEIRKRKAASGLIRPLNGDGIPLNVA